MHRLALLALLASSCAPTHALVRPRSSPPLAAYVVDMAAFSLGTIVGLSQFNLRPEQRDEALMYGGFAVGLAAWGPYWLIATEPQ